MKKGRIGSTACVHHGATPRGLSQFHSVTTPIVRSAPFTFECTSALIGYLEKSTQRTQPEYGRMGNPTVRSVEQRLAALEGTEQAQLFASGMAALTTLLLTVLESGDHLIITRDCYKRTRDFAAEFMAKFGVRASVVEDSVEAIKKAIEPDTRVIFTETPTNPHLYVLDAERLAELGRKNSILTIMDSTFATPVNFRPAESGIDFVVHSATKYLGGHNDLIAGVVAGRRELLDPVSGLLATTGAVCSPETAFLLGRGLKTLALRVERHNENGQAVAKALEEHPRIGRVFYPGLPSHPQHQIAARQMAGFGGVVTFQVDSDFEGTARFVDALKIPLLAPSLGGTESLVEQCAIMGYWDLPAQERRRYGMEDNMVRLSLGIEEAGDLIADLDGALRRI